MPSSSSDWSITSSSARSGSLEGLSLLADVLLHYVAPAVFVVWWTATADGRTRLSDALRWLAWPALYLAWAAVRWFFTGEAPYPFLDPAQNGYTQVLINIGLMLAVFVAAGLAMVAVDHAAAQLTERSERPS